VVPDALTVGGYVPNVGGIVVGALRPQKFGAFDAYAGLLGTMAVFATGALD
jgi:hypothetical protein